MTATSLANHVAHQYGAGPRLRRVDRSLWPDTFTGGSAPAVEVWISTGFLVVIYDDSGHERMSVNRAAIGDDQRWVDGITWDDLQRLKNECRRGDRWAVEVYPPDSRVVDVANIRHLWLLPEPPPYGWHPADAVATPTPEPAP